MLAFKFLYFLLCLLNRVHIVLGSCAASGSWPLCFLYMLEAAAAFLSHQLQWQALLPLSLCPSLFTFHFPLPSSLLLTLVSSVFSHSLRYISCSQLHSLCLCLVPIFPLPPQPALSVCKMIAAVELLPTPGALMKAVLRWKLGEKRNKLYSMYWAAPKNMLIHTSVEWLWFIKIHMSVVITS